MRKQNRDGSFNALSTRVLVDAAVLAITSER
jgi:hypothetical protein